MPGLDIYNVQEPVRHNELYESVFQQSANQRQVYRNSTIYILEWFRDNGFVLHTLGSYYTIL